MGTSRFIFSKNLLCVINNTRLPGQPKTYKDNGNTGTAGVQRARVATTVIVDGMALVGGLRFSRVVTVSITRHRCHNR